MEHILLNIVSHKLLDFCRENGIDPSGTVVQKEGRGFRFGLYRQDTGYEILSVILKKNDTPEFLMSEEAQAQRTKRVNYLRDKIPGYTLGALAPFATDSDLLEVCELNNKKAKIHNRALAQKR